MLKKSFAIAVFALGILSVASQSEVSKALDNLPPELQGKVSEGQINDLQNRTTAAFRERCLKNGGPDAYSRVEEAASTFTTCINKQINKEELDREIEAAKPKGEVDEVLKKYCQRSPALKQCIAELTAAGKPCLPPDEQRNFDVLYNMTMKLADFVCFKDGDRIALFIAEGGPKCLEERREDLQACFNSTFGASIDTNNITPDNLPNIAFGEKECGQLTALQQCAVASLERCELPTTANIVESLFKFARAATPCREHQTTKAQNSASTATSTVSLLAATAVALRLFTITQ